MQYLEKLDLAILDGIFQPMADWWRNRTGKSNFWIARMLWGVIITIVGWVAIFYLQMESSVMVMFVIMSAGMIGVLANYNKDEKFYEHIRVESYFNWRRQFMPWGALRLFVTITLVAVSIYSITVWSNTPATDSPIIPLSVLYGGAALIIGTLYFSACTPKPPRPLKAGNRLAAEALGTH
ncbi:MAG: hypothetical protein AAB964_01145 [Patescibacteria group bacterium]